MRPIDENGVREAKRYVGAGVHVVQKSRLKAQGRVKVFMHGVKASLYRTRNAARRKAVQKLVREVQAELKAVQTAREALRESM